MLTVVAFLGIVLGRMYRAFSQGWAVSKYPERPNVSVLSINLFAQQNHVLTKQIAKMADHLMEMNTKLIAEATDIETISQEIACNEKHIELIRSLMDDESEAIIKEVASWAHSTMTTFELSLKSVSIEPDVSVELDRTHDVVLIFHVDGSGDNALRFQAECSRKLRDIVQRKQSRSGQLLRTDVRWS